LESFNLISGGLCWVGFAAAAAVLFGLAALLWNRVSGDWKPGIRGALLGFTSPVAIAVLVSVAKRNWELPGIGTVGESRIPLLALLAGSALLFLTGRPAHSSLSHRQALSRTTLWIWVGAIALFSPLVESDGAYYFATGRSLLHDGDLNLYNEAAFHPHGWMYTTVRSVSAEGYTFNPFPVGHGLLLFPWMILGELVTSIFNLFGWNWLHDGYSPAVVFCCGLACLFYGLIGATCTTRFVAEHTRIRSAAWASVVAVLGTPVLHYIYIQSGFPHALGFCSIALFLWCWWRARDSLRMADWLLLGSVAGLASLVRWQYALYFLIPVSDFFIDAFTKRDRLPRRMTCLFAAGFCLAFSTIVQVVVFRTTSGSWLPTAYPPELFDFWKPQFLNMLFGPEHGLFTWHPIIMLGLLGLVFVPRKTVRVAILLAAMFALQAWIIAAYKPGYHGGGGFGNRLFAHALPAVALGLAAIRDRCSRWGTHWERGFLLVIAGLVVWNFLFLCMVLHAPFNEYEPYGLIQVVTQSWAAFAIKFVYHSRLDNFLGLFWHGVVFRNADWFLAGLAGCCLLGVVCYLSYLWSRFHLLGSPSARMKWTSLLVFHGFWIATACAIWNGHHRADLVHALELEPGPDAGPDSSTSYRRYRINTSNTVFQGGLGRILLGGATRTLQLAVYPEQEVHGLVLTSHVEPDPMRGSERSYSEGDAGSLSAVDADGKVTRYDLRVGRDLAYADNPIGLRPVRQWKHSNWSWPVNNSYAQRWVWEDTATLRSIRLEWNDPESVLAIEGISLLLSPPSKDAFPFSLDREPGNRLAASAEAGDRFVPIDISGVAHSDYSLDPTLIGATTPGHVPLHTLCAGTIGPRGIPIRILPSYSETGEYSTLTTCFLHGTAENPIAVPCPAIRAKRLWIAITAFFIETEERMDLVRFRVRYRDGYEAQKRLRGNRDLWDFDRGPFPIRGRIWDESNVHHHWGRIALVSIDLDGSRVLEEISIEDPNGPDRAGVVVFGMTLEKP
jgi:hypothetical protein